MRYDPLSGAAARRNELTRSKAVQALRELDRAGVAVTFAKVAQTAGVSRSWLYTQPDISGQIRTTAGENIWRRLRRRHPGWAAKATDASPQARLATALDRNRQLVDGWVGDRNVDTHRLRVRCRLPAPLNPGRRQVVSACRIK